MNHKKERHIYIDKTNRFLNSVVSHRELHILFLSLYHTRKFRKDGTLKKKAEHCVQKIVSPVSGMRDVISNNDWMRLRLRHFKMPLLQC